jgi:hypothetical protein
MMLKLKVRTILPAVFLFAVGAMIIGNLSIGSPVLADTPYCPSSDTIGSSYFNDDRHSKEDALNAMTKDDQGICASKLVNEFNANNKDNGRQITIDNMAQAISNCRVGEAENTNNNQFTNCANAYYTCMGYALQESDCLSNDTLANIASHCHDGTGVQANGENVGACGYLEDANVNHVKKQLDEKRGIYEQACMSDADRKAGGDPVKHNETYNSCLKAMNGGLDNCEKQEGSSWTYGYDRNSNFVDGNKQVDTYDACLQRALNDAAKDNADVCKAVNGGNGFYVANDVPDPTGGDSDVNKGCYSEYSDLINADACKNAGGKWVQTGGQDTSKTQDDDYGCEDPDGKKDEDEEEDKEANTDGSIQNISEQCGQARVNLLVCGKEEGAPALNGILRIVITVLSFLVGIAAVGGLAWASLQYAKAEDNSGAVSDARTLIRNIVIGILLYGFLVVIINWLVPGGVIGTGGSSGGGWFS